jgi:folate-binding protein YgfZ
MTWIAVPFASNFDVMISDSTRAQYSALNRAIGFADVSDRSQIEILGKDRAQLLHGLCTNDIKALKPGQGCEAFLTNVQGKTIGFVYVFCGSESLVIDSVPGATADIIRGLDRFVIREDVRFLDRAADWREFLIGGPQAAAGLQQLLEVEPPVLPLRHTQLTWRGGQIRLRHVPFTGPDCFFLAADRAIATSLSDELTASGAVFCDAPVVEMARIEAGSPLYGRDVTDENLPQEVDRTPLAISFVKGCYLGQETVARLDALGHVNRTLCGVKFSNTEVPPVGTEIRIDEKVVGRITSACWSVRLDAPLALAYIRRGHNQIGSRFLSPWGEAEVIRLPLS